MISFGRFNDSVIETFHPHFTDEDAEAQRKKVRDRTESFMENARPLSPLAATDSYCHSAAHLVL